LRSPKGWSRAIVWPWQFPGICMTARR